MRATEILRNAVKDKLARGEVVASMTVRLVRGGGAAEEARAVVKAAKFLPLGERGTGLQFLLAAATGKASQVREIKL